MSWARIFAAGLGLAVLAPVGCAALAGVDGDFTPGLTGAGGQGTGGQGTSGQGGAGGGGMCPASQETTACFKCNDEACCHEYDACHADPRCTQFYTVCLNDCHTAKKPFDQCLTECRASLGGAALARFAPYLACNELHCYAPCKDVNDDCANCENANCRDEQFACHKDSTCLLYGACVGLCINKPNMDACTAACKVGVPSAIQDTFNAYETCLLTSCSQTCGVMM